MHRLENKVAHLIANEKLLAVGESVVVGVSAGPDSMALFHVLLALAVPFKLRLIAAYGDHGLRPEEVAAEKALVRDTALRHGIACEIRVLPVAAHAKRHGLSLEEAGRELRYDFLRQVAEAAGGARIAVAHTADDQAEELLLRLIRGTGRKGLSGMVPVANGIIVRPFLTVPKAELLEYLRDRGIAFCSDSSNQDRRYLRNRVRLDLLPHLATHFNPNLRETLRQTAIILQDEEDLLHRLTHEVWSKVVQEGEGELRLASAAFCEQPRALQRRLLEQALVLLGSTPSFRAIEQLRRLVGATEPGTLHLSRGLRATSRGGELRLAYPRGRGANLRGELAVVPSAPAFRLVIPGPGRYELPELEMVVLVEVIDQADQKVCGPAAGVQCLDAAVVRFPLLLRNAQPGDRFWPLGAPGRKKVADFLADRKVPVAERSRVAVLESAGRVVALLGLRIDHGARVTATTATMVRITLGS